MDVFLWAVLIWGVLVLIAYILMLIAFAVGDRMDR